MDGILQDGQALIAEVEAHGCTAQGAASAYDMHVDDVGDADQHQDVLQRICVALNVDVGDICCLRA